MSRTLVFRNLQAEHAVEILRGLCTSGVLGGPIAPSDGLGANGGCDKRSAMTATTALAQDIVQT